MATGTFKKCDDENFAYEAVLDITNPVLWNPEQPYLYQVLFLSENEVIIDRIGIREIHCEGSVIYINDVKAKFKGVNRHDSDPITGSAVNMEQIKKDLIMMKQHNFNAV